MAVAVTAITDYSHDHFHALPTLDVARSNFEAKNGSELIQSTIREFFVEEMMDRTFGLALLHRHFDLGQDEKLVEYGSSSSPWSGLVADMKAPNPHVWSFSTDGSLKPTEFRYSNENPAIMGHSELAFIAKFKTLLDKHNLTDVFGLARYPGDDFQGTCEITIGNVNINLQPDDVGPSANPRASPLTFPV